MSQSFSWSPFRSLLTINCIAFGSKVLLTPNLISLLEKAIRSLFSNEYYWAYFILYCELQNLAQSRWKGKQSWKFWNLAANLSNRNDTAHIWLWMHGRAFIRIFTMVAPLEICRACACSMIYSLCIILEMLLWNSEH